jgi:hypothetical protein
VNWKMNGAVKQNLPGAIQLAREAREWAENVRREAAVAQANYIQRCVEQEVDWLKSECSSLLIKNPRAVQCVVKRYGYLEAPVFDGAAKAMGDLGFRVSWKLGRWYNKYNAIYTVSGWADEPAAEGPYR